MQYFTYDSVIHHNQNSLLWDYPDVDGLKTGFIRVAGFHIVATAKRGNKRLIAVVLGAKNKKIRSRQTKKILDYGFRQLGYKEIYEKKSTGIIAEHSAGNRQIQKEKSAGYG